MKAAVYREFGPPEVLRVIDIPKPIPKDNELLIRIFSSTVVKEDPDKRASPGINGLRKPKNPILGEEFSGEVEVVGKSVTRFQPGDLLFGICLFGTNTEYICLPQNAAMTTKPDNMTHIEAASVPNGALTALPFLRDLGKIESGQKVLINGASGSVGIAAVQLAKHFGAEVTGVCSGANLKMVRSLGADHVLDYTKEDFTQNGKTYDIVFDAVGKRNFSQCKDSLMPSGIYLTTSPSLSGLLNYLPLPRKHRKRAGFMAAGLRTARKKVADLEIIKKIIESGNLKAVIDRTYPLEDIVDAHRYVESGHKKGNVVITI